jgi:DNA polymerase III subunit gamma/tau
MSQFIVSARKYRPARFADVLGQEHISHTLKMAFSQDKLAHAFLFTGPRGVGKTTCARILAKTLNCMDMTPDYEPCGHCESCISFDDNASFSIFELDAASNNSVEHIRNLIEQVRIPPLSGKYKVFIIDEVHMLSTSAFNAFLKTLEEPPPYAIFILATTEKHKILPTILSRCQIFDFRRLQVGDIVKQLKIIATQESINTEEEALHLIATKADGAMRDALSIFDRIAGATNNFISYNAVTENLNLLDYTYYFKVVDQLITEDLSGIMLTIDEILKKGFDPEVFLTGLAEHIRQLLVSKDESTIVLIENTDVIRGRYLNQASLLSIDYLLTWLELCSECDINFRTARNKRLHLEMTMIKMVYVHSMIETGAAVSEGNSEKKKSLSQ